MTDELVGRFRQVAAERIEQIEQAWNRLVQGSSRELGVRLRRDLHTFKGEAHVVGFADVATVCHKLEELIAAAEHLGYRVPQDLDLLVMMAIRFMLLLVRRQADRKLAGIDLEGFVRQVDEVVADVRSSDPPAAVSVPPPTDAEPVDRLSAPARRRLARAAALAFVEYTLARGRTRDHLREVWQILARELSVLGTVALLPRVERHARQARELAFDLGKKIDMRLDLGGDLRVAPEIATALDTALLHLLRNAVDHGVESSAVRVAAGKPVPALIRIHADPARTGGDLELLVEDDGAGVDLEAVKRRAIDLGVLGMTAAESATSSDLLELLFHSGFSTRGAADEISGRGIGLDAVRASLADLGGTVSVRSLPGQGSTFALRAPRAVTTMPVHCFAAPGGVDLVLAVPAAWEVGELEADPDGRAVDPLHALALTAPGAGDGGAHGAVRLRRGRFDLVWRALGPVRQVTAERLGVVGEDQPIEVVRIGGQEALLVRPELATTAGYPAAR